MLYTFKPHDLLHSTKAKEIRNSKLSKRNAEQPKQKKYGTAEQKKYGKAKQKK